MSENKKLSDEIVRFDLTETQKAQVKQAIGKDAESIELEVKELEQRIAPKIMW
jgi:uncharacterized small protein (DUF1192 family)